MAEPLRLLAAVRQFPIRALAKIGVGVYRSHDLRGLPITVLELLERYRKRPSVVECPLAHCRWFGPTGLAYGPGSLHPYVQSLLQHLRGECDSYQETCLAHYWRSWTPVTLAQSLGIDPESAHPLLNACPPLSDFMPWGGKLHFEALRCAAESHVSGPLAQKKIPVSREISVRQVGPKPDWFGELRIHHLVTLHQQIASEGYRQRASACLPYIRQHLVVDCMVRDDDVRFLVANGQHRASVLSAMGQELVPVLLNVSHKRGPSVIRRSESSNWPLVRMGLIAESDALDIFDRVFDGRQPNGFPVLMRAGKV
ncbi:hypothetical protein BDK63_001823 [Halomonas campaniensis]|uniref:Uncharacterized protein n=1 Tax=Halomonas campaniensis TaxID=213554 RepID=A0A7W5K310_9GAMM|nr:hypothetical protein [Halomonas campaniensis]MBB3330948.1 hypothetical protein [Halomonas campaniensis]